MSKISKIIIFILLFINIATLNVLGIETILRVGVEPNLPPYQFKKDGELVGLHIDLLNKIAEKNNYKIEYIEFKNSSESEESLEYENIDLILGSIKQNYSPLEPFYTDSISQSNICTIAKKEIALDIKNKDNIESYNAVFENNTIRYSFIKNMRNLKYIVVSNQERAFETLLSGRADILIGVKDSALYQLEQINAEDDYSIINNYMATIEYTIIVKKGDFELLNKLNNEIDNMRISGQYEDIYEKWLISEEGFFERVGKRIIIGLAIVLLGLILISVFNYRINKILKKQVDKKTKELNETNKNLEKQIIETMNYNELNNCIVENNPNGLIIFNKKFEIISYNQNAHKFNGLENIEIGKDIFKYELLSNMISGKEEEIFNYNRNFYNEEISIETHGENRIFKYHIYKLFDYNQEIRGGILSIEDITDEVVIREQIYEEGKNKALNRMIAGIAHEIRNPLTSIKTFVEMIPRKINNENFQNQLLEHVPNEVERVNKLINNLIDYAKPSKRLKEKIQINKLIEDTMSLLENTVKGSKITINKNIQQELYIYADSNQIKQVFINIFLNGIEAIKEKANQTNKETDRFNINIKALKMDNNIIIQILDEGIGMTEEEIVKSKEPFFTTKAKGTGLGMYLIKQYIEENEGILKIESEKFKYTQITIIFKGAENENFNN
jgi:polar amino acid transport system substrate-binding protein